MFLVSLIFGLLACSSPADLIVDTGQETVSTPDCASIAGMQICDFPAIDESGGDVKLSSLYSRPIVLDLSAMWCGPCKAAGANTQETANILGGEVTILTVLIENEYGEPPTAEDLVRWKETYNIVSEPVWGSSRDILTNNPIELSGKLFLEGWPTFYFIDADGILQEYVKGYNEGQIIQQAELLLIE